LIFFRSVSAHWLGLLPNADPLSHFQRADVEFTRRRIAARELTPDEFHQGNTDCGS
jgi:hypothetical protein